MCLSITTFGRGINRSARSPQEDNDENGNGDDEDPCAIPSGEGYKKCSQSGQLCVPKDKSEEKEGFVCQDCQDDEELKIGKNECGDYCTEGTPSEQQCSRENKQCDTKDEDPFFECLNCKSGFEKQGERCVGYCTEGTPSEQECSRENKQCDTKDEDPFFECVNCKSGFEKQGERCVDYCTEGTPSEQRCSRENKQCDTKDEDPFFECGNCKSGFEKQGERCVEPCDVESGSGYQDCSSTGKICNFNLSNPEKAYSCEDCPENQILVRGRNVCEEPDPCASNPCRNDGNCTKIDINNYECLCKDPFYGNNCERENLCKRDKDICGKAVCKFDESYHTYICSCTGDSEYFDYANKKCEKINLCFNVTCSHEKFQKCYQGICKCFDGLKKNAEEECEFLPDECINRCGKNAKCNIIDYPGTVDCVCNDGYYFNAATSNCKAKSCSVLTEEFHPCDQTCDIKDGNITCTCDEEFTASGEKCELKDENRCNKTDIENGECVKKGNDETIRCNKGYEFRDSKCIDICALDGRSPEFCPHGCIRESDQIKCNCTGEYILASDGITCKKRTSCTEEEVEECMRTGKYCRVSDRSPWYECNCAEYYQEIDGECTGSCTAEQAKECASTNRQCRYNSKVESKVECFCPFTMVYNDTSRSCMFDENYTFLTLTLKSKNSDKHKAYAPVANDDNLMEDITDAMRTLYGGSFREARIVSNRSQEKGLEYTISVIYDDITEYVETRILHEEYCISIDDSYCLLPPRLVVAKNLNNGSLTNDRCDERVRQHFCPSISNKCTSERGGYNCICEKGFQTVTSFFIGNNADYIYESCIDIDECLDPSTVCQKHSKCKNTFGSYECVCDEGYMLSGDEKECKGLCDVNPCKNNGKCDVAGGNYECTCPKEFVGRNCEIENKDRKKAATNIIVVGAVLGGVLLISFIVILVLVRKVKKKSGGDDYDTQMSDYGKAFGKNIGDRERVIRGDRYGKHTYDNPASS